MKHRNDTDKQARKRAAGRLAIDLLLDTWNQFAVGDNTRRWAGGVSTLNEIEKLLQRNNLIDGNGQQTEKAKRGEHLVLERPDTRIYPESEER